MREAIREGFFKGSNQGGRTEEVKEAAHKIQGKQSGQNLSLHLTTGIYKSTND